MSDNDPKRLRRNTNAGLLAGLAGLAAVGSIAGVTVARSMTRRITSDDPYAGEDFERIDADRSSVVTTPDGIDLAVREVGPEQAPLTVVFAHGFCLRMAGFHFQRVRLEQEWGPQVRMVFYDQRGHGQSAEAPPDTYTIEQLGRDLDTVLTVTAPKGPVVVVGHSMGGMTVLSHARQYPRRYPTRIVGAALISSAAEGVARAPVAEILKNPALEAVRFAVRYAPTTVHRARGAAKKVVAPILRTASYGDARVSPSVVSFSEKMMHGTPIVTLIEFLHALEVHNEDAGLRTLASVPTLIACGDRDLITPAEHSEAMAAGLPKSELVIVRGAGHLVQLERPDLIDDALVRLVERATPSKLVALTRRIRDRARPHG